MGGKSEKNKSAKKNESAGVIWREEKPIEQNRRGGFLEPGVGKGH